MLRWLFPVKCPFCGRILREGFACADCLAALPRPDPVRLESLARSAGCRRLYAPFRYERAVRDALHAFKFRDKPEFARAFAPEIARLTRERYDLIVCAPMRYYHRNSRGYNQAELLARQLSRLLDAPFVPLLHKDRRNRTQHGLSADERAENVRDVYSVRGAVPGMTVLLVDDVVTTGSTMRVLADCLRDAGARAVDGAAYAVVQPRSFSAGTDDLSEERGR